MFGWGEFKKDGKYREDSTVWQAEENRKEGKPGRLFSPGPTNFFLPNREEKPGEKILLQHFYHNALSHLSSFMTFSPTPPDDSCPQILITFFPLLILPSQHTNIQWSRFFFFFQRDLLLLTIFLLVTKSFAELNLYIHYCNFYFIIIKIII